MTATVLILEKNGAGETATDKTSGTVRFKSADEAAVDSNNRLTIPTSGNTYSYRKVLRLQVTVAPDTDINNPVVYSDNVYGFGDGIDVWYAVGGSYVQPTIPSVANNPPQFPGTTPMGLFFNATSGAPIALDANNAGPYTGTGDIADYLNLVMGLTSGAASGTLAAETITFSYDET